MISLCSVVLGPINRYLPYFIDNITTKTTLVREIVLCNLDSSYVKESSISGIKIKEIGLQSPIATLPNCCWKAVGHSVGMMEAIRHAHEPFIFMCDPDILFYTAVDQIYYNLMHEHKLNFIGAAHHISVNYSCKWFPNPINMMVRKNDLPKPENLKNIIKASCVSLSHGLTDEEDHYFEENILVPGKQEVVNSYPNPDGIADTGVLLYWWNQRIGGRWLSFVTQDVHNYTTKVYRNNFDLKDRIPAAKLFYHATSGADHRYMYWEDFKKTYEEIREND